MIEIATPLIMTGWGIVIGFHWALRHREKHPTIGDRFMREFIPMARKDRQIAKFAGPCIVRTFEVEFTDLGRFKFTVEPMENQHEKVPA